MMLAKPSVTDLTRCLVALEVEPSQLARDVTWLTARLVAETRWPLAMVLEQLVIDTLGGPGTLTEALDVLDDSGKLRPRLRAVLACGTADVRVRHGSIVHFWCAGLDLRHECIKDSNGCPSVRQFQPFTPHLTDASTFTFRTGVIPEDNWVLYPDVLGRVVIAPDPESLATGWDWRFPSQADVTQKLPRLP